MNVANATENNATSLRAMGDSVTQGIASMGIEPRGVNYLWLPYVILTLILLSLLVASFIHFHVKYRDRYVKRSVLAKAVKISPDEDGGLTPVASQNNLYIPDTLQRVPSGAKTRRLKMFYGNKVDVSSIVVNSMYDPNQQSPQHNSNQDLNTDDMYYHMDNTPRTLQVPGLKTPKETAVTSEQEKPTKPKYMGFLSGGQQKLQNKKQHTPNKAQTGL